MADGCKVITATSVRKFVLRDKARNERTVPLFQVLGPRKEKDMHIAVCDDNLADRHQMERLLGRESDKQDDTSEMFIIDSYGNPEVMLSHPKAFDLFFIDVCQTEGLDAVKIVQELIARGATGPIVMCCSQIDYRTVSGLPENAIYIDKPIKVADLHNVLEQVKEFQSELPDKIELRKHMDTVYVNVSDVIYAVEKKGITLVTLTDGEVLTSPEPLWLFKRSLGDKHPEIEFATPMILVNVNHIKSWGHFGTAIMDNGKSIHVARSQKEKILQLTGESNT